jgi:hypothetical protein
LLYSELLWNSGERSVWLLLLGDTLYVSEKLNEQ